MSIAKLVRRFHPDLCRLGNSDMVPRRFSCWTGFDEHDRPTLIHDARCIELHEAVTVIVERVERQRDEAMARLARAGRLAATALSDISVETGRLTDMDFDFQTLLDALRGVHELARPALEPHVGKVLVEDVTLARAVALMRKEVDGTLCIMAPIEKVGRKGGITKAVSLCPPDAPCWWCQVRAFVDTYDGKTL